MEYSKLCELAGLRIDHSRECLSAARSLFDSGNYKSAANRCYYTVFHAMRAVLAMDKIDMKHHSGIISEFRRLYIKTGAFDIELSKIISVLYETRTDSDYDDFFTVTRDEVAEEITMAEAFLNNVSDFLKEKSII